MSTYRTKQQIVDAISVDGAMACAAHDWAALPGWLRDAYEGKNPKVKGIVFSFEGISVIYPISPVSPHLEVPHHGWLVHDSSGNILCYTAQDFAALYEPVP